MDRLKYLMHDYDLNITKLAEMTGYTRQTIANYVNGKTTPDINFICKVADCCGCSVDYVLGRSNYVNEEEIINHTIQNCIHKLIEFGRNKK